MVFKIETSERADRDFENIINYLEENWSEKVAFEFAEKLNEVKGIIQKMPYLYPYISKRKKVRRCVITKHNTIYYQVNNLSGSQGYISGTTGLSKKLLFESPLVEWNIAWPKEGTITMSNFGVLGGGGLWATPVINYPEVAILGVSRAMMKPVYVEGALVPRLMLPLSLSYDHRVIDGAEGARFMKELNGLLSDVCRILL